MSISSLIEVAERADIVLFVFGDNTLAVVIKKPPPAKMIDDLYRNAAAVVAELRRREGDR